MNVNGDTRNSTKDLTFITRYESLIVIRFLFYLSYKGLQHKEQYL
jgi:hypothetical protein